MAARIATPTGSRRGSGALGAGSSVARSAQQAAHLAKQQQHVQHLGDLAAKFAWPEALVAELLDVTEALLDRMPDSRTAAISTTGGGGTVLLRFRLPAGGGRDEKGRPATDPGQDTVPVVLCVGRHYRTSTGLGSGAFGESTAGINLNGTINGSALNGRGSLFGALGGERSMNVSLNASTNGSGGFWPRQPVEIALDIASSMRSRFEVCADYVHPTSMRITFPPSVAQRCRPATTLTDLLRHVVQLFASSSPLRNAGARVDGAGVAREFMKVADTALGPKHHTAVLSIDGAAATTTFRVTVNQGRHIPSARRTAVITCRAVLRDGAAPPQTYVLIPEGFYGDHGNGSAIGRDNAVRAPDVGEAWGGAAGMPLGKRFEAYMGALKAIFSHRLPLVERPNTPPAGQTAYVDSPMTQAGGAQPRQPAAGDVSWYHDGARRRSVQLQAPVAPRGAAAGDEDEVMSLERSSSEDELGQATDAATRRVRQAFRNSRTAAAAGASGTDAPRPPLSGRGGSVGVSGRSSRYTSPVTSRQPSPVRSLPDINRRGSASRPPDDGPMARGPRAGRRRSGLDDDEEADSVGPGSRGASLTGLRRPSVGGGSVTSLPPLSQSPGDAPHASPQPPSGRRSNSFARQTSAPAVRASSADPGSPGLSARTASVAVSAPGAQPRFGQPLTAASVLGESPSGAGAGGLPPRSPGLASTPSASPASGGGSLAASPSTTVANGIAEAEACKTQPAENEDEACVICMENRRTHICLPCGHYVLCGPCCAKCTECPACRQKIAFRTKVFH